jgi:heterodisulfide reductase subunit B
VNSLRSQTIERGTEGAPLRAASATVRAANDYAYYPGCSLHGTSREFDESLRAVAAELRVGLTEVTDWSCCGASSGHTTDHLLGVALPARNLALAESQGFSSVLAPCAACYNRLSAARLAVAEEEGLAERIPDILGRPFANTVEVHNAVELLRDAASDIEEKLAAALTTRPNPMEGVKLASYYGCLLVRPFEVCGYDDPEQPTSMDDVVRACGAEPVDWDMKVECCGGSFSVSRTASVLRLGRSIIENARAHGAEAIVVACPLCHSNLDLRQKAAVDRGAAPMPILFITQVAGLALRLSPVELGLTRHFVDTEPFLADLLARANVRVEEEKKLQAEAAAKAAARAEKQKVAAAAAGSGDASGDAPEPAEGGEAQ